MNEICKVGDLAIIVRDMAGKDIGKIVEVTGKFSDTHFECDTLGQRITVGDADNLGLRLSLPGEKVAFHYTCLRPIRDEEGEDETLTWAPSPTKELV